MIPWWGWLLIACTWPLWLVPVAAAVGCVAAAAVAVAIVVASPFVALARVARRAFWRSS